MHDIDTALLRAFVAVVDTGNFSRAARRLNRTQSALSMQIKRLEDAVETVLFERSVRPPSITPAGELFVAYAREMLALNDAAIKTIKANKTAGQVRLALMEDYASTILAPVLTQFMAENQDVQVEVHTGLTNSFVDQLGVQFDLVIAMVPIGYNDGELLYSGKSVWGGAACFEPRTFDPLPLALNRNRQLLRPRGPFPDGDAPRGRHPQRTRRRAASACRVRTTEPQSARCSISRPKTAI